MNNKIFQLNIDKYKLILFFFELSLKKKKNWNNKLMLNLNLVVKSFYKNEEFSLLNNLLYINNNLLYKFSNNLFKIYYLFKLLSFFVINDYTNFKNNMVINDRYINYKLNTPLFKDLKILNKSLSFIKKKNNNKFKKLNNYYFISIYFFFMYFIYLLNLKLLNNNNFIISKLPNKNKKITLLRSPHIDKKSREQFEIITHKSMITSTNFLGEKTIDFLSRKTNNLYIEVMYN
jgi:hypothetical protein